MTLEEFMERTGRVRAEPKEESKPGSDKKPHKPHKSSDIPDLSEQSKPQE